MVGICAFRLPLTVFQVTPVPCAQHGEGNWNLVQRNTGLRRCGKSCRLRWANHLRPDLKRGAFTPHEEALIVGMHSQIGNKWARMAAQVSHLVPHVS